MGAARFAAVLLVVATGGCVTQHQTEMATRSTGRLLEDTCLPGCDDNLTCDEGRCQFTPQSCTEDRECALPYACIEGSCLLHGGAKCREDAQCSSNKCSVGVCSIEL